MKTRPVHQQRKSRGFRLIKGLGMSLAVASVVPAASSAEPDRAGAGLWDGLRANMPAGEVAAYLKGKGVSVEETTREGVAVVIVNDRERFVGMKGEMSLGFSRRGLQTFSYDFDGKGLADHDTLVDRLTALYGKPVGRFAPRLYRGYNGNSASTHVFFGGPPRSVSLFYRMYCPPYARRQGNEKSISITVDLRPIAFPPSGLAFPGDADGWCDAG